MVAVAVVLAMAVVGVALLVEEAVDVAIFRATSAKNLIMMLRTVGTSHHLPLVFHNPMCMPQPHPPAAFGAPPQFTSPYIFSPPMMTSSSAFGVSPEIMLTPMTQQMQPSTQFVQQSTQQPLQTFWGNSSQASMPQQMSSSNPMQQQMQPINPISSHNPQAMTIGSTAAQSSNWYPDSGASHHVTSNVENIQQCAPFEGPDQVIIGNGQGLPIRSIGSSTFISPTNNTTNLLLSKLLHVPTISKNLLSISQFAKDNSVYFEFHPNVCLVKSQGSNDILLKGHLGSDR